MKEILITSSKDNTIQPSLFYYAGEENRPLLVGLHTWSFGRENQIENMLPVAKKYNWNLLLPEFRGPNLKCNPDCLLACGSEVAKQDIFDAIKWVLKEYKIDKNNIIMLGLSGGGHMALLTTAEKPDFFKAVAAFVPVCDLKDWCFRSDYYRESIIACLGGTPDEKEEEYKKRSPISYIDELAKANLKIFHGKFDDTVPAKQSIDLYRKIFEKYPDARVFLDIFDGGHEINMESAASWFLSQMNEAKMKKVTG